jgi:hypothetical protein
MKSLKKIFALLLFTAVSCEEPETLVTNIINTDGSVLRRIEMRNVKDNFSADNVQVPFDSTWNISDTIEVNEKGDTTWIKTAEKLFSDPEEINTLYSNDQGSDRKAVRQISVSRRFRWFHTSYKFSEEIKSELQYGFPLKDYLNEEELQFFYYPESLSEERLNGTDSLKYKALSDTIDKKTERWLFHSLVSEWIGRFGQLTRNNGGEKVGDELRSKEKEILDLYDQNNQNFDSLVESGALLKNVIGDENAAKYKSESDSAFKIVSDGLWLNFSGYSVQVKMPGKLTGTNGFPDNNKMLLWPVRSEFFLTQDYQMWAESKVQNVWAWVVTGIFVFFVFTGLIFRNNKKG